LAETSSLTLSSWRHFSDFKWCYSRWFPSPAFFKKWKTGNGAIFKRSQFVTCVTLSHLWQFLHFVLNWHFLNLKSSILQIFFGKIFWFHFWMWKFSEKSYFCNFDRSEIETVRFFESNSVETVSISTSIWNRFKIGSILRLFLANREILFLFDGFKTSVSHSSAIT